MANSAAPAAGRIFISYRREETAYAAGWLFDRLSDRFGRGQIFKDIDSVEPGDNFVKVITKAVASCDVLLALIGDRWLTITDEQGTARLDNANDFVRLEIEAALEGGAFCDPDPLSPPPCGAHALPYHRGMTHSQASTLGSPVARARPAGRVLLAKPRGYCAGVDRAVQTVEQALDHYGPPVYVRKQIVHNLHVVEALERRGAVFVEETEEVPEGAIVVFSAHGVAPEVHAEAQRRQLKTIDATCPLVTKVHNEARRFAAEGYDILLIGHEGHEEVVGTTGEAPEHVTLVDGPHGVASTEVRDPAKVVWLSQTTLSVDETMQTVDELRERFPLLESPPSDDICYATQNRQAAVKVIAPQVQLFLVVGSANSSNSVRMVEVALAAGAWAAHLVENATLIDPAWLAGVTSIGLSSGASVPEILVTEVVQWLAEQGYTDLEEVSHTEERLTFALPQELRRDLKTVDHSR